MQATFADLVSLLSGLRGGEFEFLAFRLYNPASPYPSWILGVRIRNLNLGGKSSKHCHKEKKLLEGSVESLLSYMAFFGDSRGQKSNPNLFFLKPFGRPRGYPSEIPGYPAQKV